WATFRKAFEVEYLPSAVRQERKNEFMQLRQRNKTVQQYAAEFNRLSKFAGAFLQSEECRVPRFEVGLRPSISAHVAVPEYRTMGEASLGTASCGVIPL
ncbi:hypothetical protein ACDT16_13985, partial [Staphylococcus aureus]